MSLIVVETTVEQPLDLAVLNDEHERIMPCLTVRNIEWRYSWVAHDLRRMVCTFDAPDAESVREAYRRAGLFSRPTWASNLQQSNGVHEADLTDAYILQGHSALLTEMDWNEICRQLAESCAKLNLDWLSSYLSLDRTRIIYEFKSLDAAALQHIQHQVGITDSSLWSARWVQP